MSDHKSLFLIMVKQQYFLYTYINIKFIIFFYLGYIIYKSNNNCQKNWHTYTLYFFGNTILKTLAYIIATDHKHHYVFEGFTN